MQTALVAGGSGFLGSFLCESLLKEYNVICVDNFITGDKRNINHLLPNSKFTFIEQDIAKELSGLRAQISNLDFVFHLASPASPNRKSPNSYINYPIETLRVNSVGTDNLLGLVKDLNSKFLYVSSSEIYGDPLVSPQGEGYFGNVNPNGVRSVYDEGKRFGEAMTMAYFRKYGTDVRIIRIFNTYGPRMQADDGRVISSFINQAISGKPLTVYGDGSQTRSFCFVEDMVKGLKKAMFSDQTKGQVFNLGNADERKILEIAKLVKQMTGSQSDIKFEDLPEDDPHIRKPDLSKAKKILSWEPETDLEDGLNKTIEYFKNL